MHQLEPTVIMSKNRVAFVCPISSVSLFVHHASWFSPLSASLSPGETHKLPRRDLLRHSLSVTVSALLPSRAGSAATYDRHAETYDVLDGSTPLTRLLGFDAMRAELLSVARGKVIELGAGTGVNFDFYPSTVTNLTAVDASALMLRHAAARARVGANPALTTVVGDAATTGLPGAAFDTVVATFALCVMPDAAAVAREMRRLITPTGTALVLDYSRSRLPVLAAYQDVTASTVARWSKGCVPNLNLQSLLTDAGFSIISSTSTLAGTILALQLRPIQL